MKRPSALLCLGVSLLLGCPPSGGGGTSTSDTGTETGGGQTGSGLGSDCTNPERPSALGWPDAAVVSEEYFFAAGDICTTAELQQGGTDMGTTISFVVSRPGLGPLESWPLDPDLPLMVFHRGVQQNADKYPHIIDPLVRQGVVVANVTSGSQTASAESRAAAMRCATRAIRTELSGVADHLSCELWYAGHSAGGAGAHLASRMQQDADPMDPTADFTLKGLIGIAPGLVDSANANSLDGPDAVPAFFLEGARDEQTAGHSVSGFDLVSPEETLQETDAARTRVWMYGAEHDEFGGGANIQIQDGWPFDATERAARGNTVVSAYVSEFVRLFLLEHPGERSWFTGEAWPQEIVDMPQWWDYLATWDGLPPLYVGFNPPNEGGIRAQVDNFNRTGDLSPASSGAMVTTTLPLGPNGVEIGTSSNLGLARVPIGWASRTSAGRPVRTARLRFETHLVIWATTASCLSRPARCPNRVPLATRTSMDAS